jgi:alkylation response protein AidB-like acyl-CoA dehydrogenase
MVMSGSSTGEDVVHERQHCGIHHHTRRTDPKGGSKSLSMILVPTMPKGLTIGPAEKKMGLRGSPTHA